MQTDSNNPNPSNVAATNSNSAPGKLLIPRSQRRRFFLLFTFMTVLGWVVGGVFSLAIERILTQSLFAPGSLQLQTWSYGIRLLSNIVFAVVFAADQALVIRRYLSGWQWTIATSIGWLTADCVATAWINYISAIASSLNETLSPELVIIFGFLSTIAYIFSGIWLGLIQWLVLRRYTIKAWWWIFVPSVAFLLISLLVWLLSFVQNFIPEAILYGSQQGFTAIILGVVPAIGLCSLKRRLQRQTQVS
ncbi:hypothetical protein H6G76_25485 [Nostoc sp. FACHB-152]|uniref:hypothetical protein n=1 Tax=unclassified Nostoc TaxID=2593658 RepID=UPI00168764AA|nr:MULTISPECIES: hypothetical protein [unclassified Nostoc]MBD2450446.1 hypothetical protein [Nostoc sp. FACHB-152]MBD2471667.1 hypothetical protein [Nostoc sp. FACHB-145]